MFQKIFQMTIWERLDWGYAYHFSVDYESIFDDILDIYKHLMKKQDIK